MGTSFTITPRVYVRVSGSKTDIPITTVSGAMKIVELDGSYSSSSLALRVDPVGLSNGGISGAGMIQYCWRNRFIAETQNAMKIICSRPVGDALLRVIIT